MCKMLFIGTNTELKEIPVNPEHTDIAVMPIHDEFLAVANKFEKKNVYFVATSRGCSCDFGTKSNSGFTTVDETTIENQMQQERSVLDPIRKLFGKQAQHVQDKIVQAQQKAELQRRYWNETQKLVEILRTAVLIEEYIELYCCWAGEYDAPIESHKTIHVSQVRLEGEFEIELNEKVRLIR